MRNFFMFTIAIVFLLINSCSVDSPLPTDTGQALKTKSSSTSPTDVPTSTSTPVPPTPTQAWIEDICMPISGATFDDLVSITSKAYETPWPGNDFSHPGVDFAYYGIEGLGVTAAMEGEVVTILDDKAPYGHVVIIETSLEEIDPRLVESLMLPEIIPTVIPDPRMNCPTGELSYKLDTEKRSLYILYGHLKNSVTLQIGEIVSCGQQVGEVGNTGWSSNPHLHFEVRVGPSGARFESMEYGTLQGSQIEKYNYCTWRASNLFQSIEPMRLLSLG